MGFFKEILTEINAEETAPVSNSYSASTKTDPFNYGTPKSQNTEIVNAAHNLTRGLGISVANQIKTEREAAARRAESPAPEGEGTVVGNPAGGWNVVLSALNRALGSIGWNAAGISAMMGMIFGESSYRPNAVNKAEMNGTFTASSANGAGYGAGLIQWSNNRKAKALEIINNMPANIENNVKRPNVESSTAEEQAEVIRTEIEHMPKLNAYMKNLPDTREGVARGVACLYTNFVGGYRDAGLPSQDVLSRTINSYANVNGNSGYNNKLGEALRVFARI